MNEAERKLIRFAGEVLDMSRGDGWPGDVDGGALQDAAERLGVLVPVPVTEACGEMCSCADCGDFPMECYRLEAIVATTLTEAEAPSQYCSTTEEKT